MNSRTILLKRICIATVCLLASIGVIIFLYKISETPNTFKNGFERKFSTPLILTPKYFTELPSANYYIAGQKDQRFYLANNITPNEMISFDRNLKDSIHIQLPLPHKGKSAEISVDPEYTYAISTNESYLYHLANFPRNLDFTSFKITAGGLNLARAISNSTIIGRAFDTSIKTNTIIKFDLQPSLNKKTPAYVLEKQIDGLICTDGILSFDRSSNRIIYVFSYRNQFVCLDTNLALVYQARTIDTTSRAKIKIGKIFSNQFTSLASPAFIINQATCIANKKLLIRSTLLSDNENRQNFSRCSVIDIYNISDGHYSHSFYIPDYNGLKVSSFAISQGTLMAIHGPYVFTYNIGGL
jgi:hypothetical protein